jgi:hypothetical protein
MITLRIPRRSGRLQARQTMTAAPTQAVPDYISISSREVSSEDDGFASDEEFQVPPEDEMEIN